MNAISTNNSVCCMKMKMFTFRIAEISAVRGHSRYLIKSSHFNWQSNKLTYATLLICITYKYTYGTYEHKSSLEVITRRKARITSKSYGPNKHQLRILGLWIDYKSERDTEKSLLQEFFRNISVFPCVTSGQFMRKVCKLFTRNL
jgi:hypothetical protein